MSKEILVYDDNLPNTPGWATMSPQKQEWLQKQHSDLKKLAGVEGLAAVSGALKLYETKIGLREEDMSITDYIENNYPSGRATGFRKINGIESLIEEGWTPELIKGVAERGALLLQGAASIALGDLVNVSKRLKSLPKKRDPETIDAFIQGPIRENIREDRSSRKRKKATKEEDLLKVALIYLNRILNEFGETKTSVERRALLKKITGMTMEVWALPGKIEVERMSVPDELRPKAVGRPRGSEEKAA